MDIEDLIPPFWHAYNALDGQQTGNGLKQQLKVLAFNVASCLGVQVDKEDLEKYKEKEVIQFQDFLAFLKKEVFEKIAEKDDQNANKTQLKPEEISDICWLVCQKHYSNIFHSHKHISAKEDIHKCWLVFNFLSEKGDDEKPIIPVVIHRQEVELVMAKMLSYIGKLYDKDNVNEIWTDEMEVSFEQYLGLLEEVCCKSLDEETVSATIQELYAEFILQVLKRGYLEKKAPSGSFRSTTRRWFVLTPQYLEYFTDNHEHERKGQIEITQHCRTGIMSSHEKGKSYRFIFAAEGRTFDLNAPDARTRTEWCTLLQTAIDSTRAPYGPQKMAWLKRRNERKAADTRRREEAEKTRRDQDTITQKQQELEEARRAHEELETSMREELQKKDAIIARLKEIEQERARLEEQLTHEASARDSLTEKLKALEQEKSSLQESLEKEIEEKDLEKARIEELERINASVQARLAEEEQARRDEEIVRHQAALALKEEMEKSEQLEQLKLEHEKQLQEEQQVRRDLEQLKREQDEQLELERQKLQQLTLDREQKDKELQEAQEKLTAAESAAERAREDVEKKVKDTQNPEFRRLLMERIYQEHLEGTPEIISHRGKGAFVIQEFETIAQARKEQLLRSQSESVDSIDNLTDSGETPNNHADN